MRGTVLRLVLVLAFAAAGWGLTDSDAGVVNATVAIGATDSEHHHGDGAAHGHCCECAAAGCPVAILGERPGVVAMDERTWDAAPDQRTQSGTRSYLVKPPPRPWA